MTGNKYTLVENKEIEVILNVVKFFYDWWGCMFMAAVIKTTEEIQQKVQVTSQISCK